GNSWLIPDVSATWPDQRIANDYYQGAPMIAIEVESPGNTAEELDRKVFAYLKNGAGEVWLVYPRTNSMLVHSSLDQKVIRVTGEYQTTLVPELIVRLQDLLSKRP
ncbi:MAG: Uma2 family endonuclease, partial [Bryobacteraceae bacterium]